MPLFGRKNRIEEKVPEEFKLQSFDEPIKTEFRKEITEKPASAPLFIKLDRYKNILDAINEMKMIIIKMKNAISILAELERLRNENLKMVKEAIDMMDNKIVSLDSEFIKPSGFQEKPSSEIYVEEFGEGLSDVLANLKNQVNQLKSELQAISQTEK